MNFNIGKAKDIYLSTTDVENLFINEYMTEAPGDYVKVYLLGLLYAQSRTEFSFESMARTLNLTNSEVDDAWNYWSRLGLVRKCLADTESSFNYDIEFLSLREKMYGFGSDENEEENNSRTTAKTPSVSTPAPEKKGTGETQTKSEQTASAARSGSRRRNRTDIKNLFSHVENLFGQPLSPRDMQEIGSWITEDGISCGVVEVAYDYCYNINKKNVNYVGKVAKDWHSRGFVTADDARTFVQQVEQNNERYRTVFKSLGFFRNPTEAERTEIDKWFEEMHFSMEKVLEACAQTTSIANPNIKYVGKVLENWHKQTATGAAGETGLPMVSVSVLNKYLEKLRLKAESDARNRRAALYESLPELAEIDRELQTESKNLSACFASGFNKGKIDEIRSRQQELKNRRTVLLEKNNYSADITDIKYSCANCRDTGSDDNGQKCGCLSQRIREADLWQNGKLQI